MSSRELDFHTETGRISLDWIATLGDRSAVPLERINSSVDLGRWLRVVAGHVNLREPDATDLSAAKRLRGSLIKVIQSRKSELPPAPQDIRVLNEFAALPPPPMKLATSGRETRQDADLSPLTVLGVIARDAIELLTSDDWSQVKLCAADDCSVYFVDYSRPNNRRWCSMSRCGNKAKKKTFLRRSKRTSGS